MWISFFFFYIYSTWNGLELITGESARIVEFAKCAICWSCSRGATIQTITVLDQFSGTTFPFHASLIIQRIFDKYYWTNFQNWPYIIPKTIARENTFNRKIIEEIQNGDTRRKLFSSSSSFWVTFQKDNRQGDTQGRSSLKRRHNRAYLAM